MTEQEIRELFALKNVPLSKADVWQVQSALVVKHAALERLAAALGIQFGPPEFLRKERDEAVVVATGWVTDANGVIRNEWSTGEAVITDGTKPGNYKVTGRQAAYPYAMSEKRAKDRVILKLANLHGAYSEDESDDFKPSRETTQQTVSLPANGSADAPRNPPSDGFVEQFVNGEPPARRSAHGAKKDGLWDKIEASLAAKNDWLGLAIFATEDFGPLPAAWPAQIIEAWGKQVADLLARECQTPAEVKHWCVENDATIRQLPVAYTNELRAVCASAMASLRKLEAVS